jgi:DNA-binding transcriptional regulator YiaG
VVASVTDPGMSTEQEAIEVLPMVVVSKSFPARPSSIPEIREFVRQNLADSPLTEEDNRALSQTVFRSLLAAAGPTGTIQVSFRIFPDHIEVDVLHSHSGLADDPGLAQFAESRTGAAADEPATTFANWMAAVLRREGLTREAAARQLGVSVKTVSRWVGGETEPRLRDLRRIQERFGDSPLP